MTRPAPAKNSLLRILAPIALVLVAFFFTVKQGDALLVRALALAFPDQQTNFQSVWFDWDGDVIAKQLVLRPNDMGAEAEVRFERVHLETPGWGWFLTNSFDRALAKAELGRVRLMLTEGSSVAGLDPLLLDLGPIGAVSASPFETEGCAGSAVWSRDQLIEMGLSPGPTSLDLTYVVEGDRLISSVALETQGVSRTQLDRRVKLAAPVATLLGGRPSGLVEFERWDVLDHGFVLARNRYCAARDGVDARRFVERHLAAVDRLLKTIGLEPDLNSRTLYRRFARGGGDLAFGGEYVVPMDGDQFVEARLDGRALLMMNAMLERDGRGVATIWREVPRRPLAGTEDGLSTYAAMELERTGAAVAAEVPVAVGPNPSTAAPADTSAGTPGGIPAGIPPENRGPSADANKVTVTPPTPAPTASSVVTAPENPGVSAPATNLPAPGLPALPPSAAIPPAPTPPASTASVPGVTAAEPPNPAVIEPASTAPSPALTPASGTTQRPARPRIERLAPVDAPRDLLDWDSLERYRGQRIRLWTVHNPPRTVELLDANDRELRVRVRLSGGQAEYTVQRAGFLQAKQLR